MSSLDALFFRIQQPDPDDKGDALRQAIANTNRGESNEETFQAKPNDFSAVPGSPFAYWASQKILNLFTIHPQFEQDGRIARVGDHPGEQDRFIRLFWEVPPQKRSFDRQWVPYQKGGTFSKYYADIHLLVDWDFERNTYYGFYGRKGRSSEHPSNYKFFFRAGLTWPRRTNLLSIRILPEGCIFADKGPGIFVENDDPKTLYMLNGLLNSLPFLQLIKIQLARTELARSYEVGVIQNTPIPDCFEDNADAIYTLSFQAHELVREYASQDEITHAFKLPKLLQKTESDTLNRRLNEFIKFEIQRLNLVETIQTDIDNRVAEFYGVQELLKVVDAEPNQCKNHETSQDEDEKDAWEIIADTPQDLVADLLMWCVGAAFSRWDVRFAIDQSLLPELQGPFDPLPVCAPGALVSPDGLPAKPDCIVSEAWLRARPNLISLPEDFQGVTTIQDEEYPLPVAWSGILIDESSHSWDIVTAVRRVLQLIWGDQATDIENEACRILEYDSLRDWFRDPNKGFYNFHIKRYSKSRRKAPIYWLLQSAKRNYSLFLFYHRLTKDTYFLAGREFVDAKIKLEENRLDEMRQSTTSKSGSALKAHEKAIADQVDLVEEIKAFGKALDVTALLELNPDLNDGVVLNIAPLYELTPWKEAQKYWDELLKGKYTWSTISQQLLQKGYRKRMKNE